MRQTDFCVCGAGVGALTFLGHVDADADDVLVACNRCLTSARTRELYEARFGFYVEARRSEHDGLTRKQRDRARRRITSGWDTRRKEEREAERLKREALI